MATHDPHDLSARRTSAADSPNGDPDMTDRGPEQYRPPSAGMFRSAPSVTWDPHPGGHPENSHCESPITLQFVNLRDSARGGPMNPGGLHGEGPREDHRARDHA
jgi:hypothetical protein